MCRIWLPRVYVVSAPWYVVSNVRTHLRLPSILPGCATVRVISDDALRLFDIGLALHDTQCPPPVSV